MSLAKSVQTEWDLDHPTKSLSTRGFTTKSTVPNLKQDVIHERNRLGPLHLWPTREQLGALLNNVAWKHRGLGVGLSAKPHGYNVPMPRTGIMIASDILHFQKENVLIDCLISAGEISQPGWEQVVHHNDPQRVWVAPVDPLDVVLPPPVKEPDIDGRIKSLEERLNILSNTLLELRQAIENRPQQAVGELVRTVLTEYEVKGKTSSSFAHQHSIHLSLEKRK